MSEKLTHFNAAGKATMVDVGDKDSSRRIAVARGEIRMQPDTLSRILDKRVEKGDVLGVARLAGIMAAKKTPELIPLCHPLPIDSVEVDFTPDHQESLVKIEARVSVNGRTGVEMEALTAVSVAALTIYDMCKAVDKSMTIGPIRLTEKQGGRSGHFINPEEPA
jgi:cyclic pyranopterin monophosphate synthase